MWFGHITIALIISALFYFDFRITLICLFFSWLPNVDTILVKLDMVKKEFHDGPTHSIIFSIIFGIIVSIFSLKYGLIASVCYFLHLVSDLPTDKGISLLYPFTKKKFTINLWKSTGFLDIKNMVEYYKQTWAKILELLLILILILIIKIIS